MMTWDVALPGAQLVLLLLIWRTLKQLPIAEKQWVPTSLGIPKAAAPPDDTVHFKIDSLFLAALFRYCTSDGMNEVFSFIGGIRVLQTTLLVVSLPILIIGVVMSVSIVKTLNEDFPKDAPTKS